MREIKFRVWTGNRMVSADSSWSGAHGTVELFTADTGYEDAAEWSIYQILQFTGLQDKHGTDIYEGDILAGIFDEDSPNKVYWRAGSFWITDGYNIELLAHYQDHAEVIGNIHENPELLTPESNKR